MQMPLQRRYNSTCIADVQKLFLAVSMHVEGPRGGAMTRARISPVLVAWLYPPEPLSEASPLYAPVAFPFSPRAFYA